MKKQEIKVKSIRLNQHSLMPKAGENYAEIIWIGDVHLGSPQCDKPRFQAMIDFCVKNKVYVMLMGDLIEMATKDSVGAGVYEQESIGQNQYEEMLKILTPLAEKKLILGIHNGN